MVPIETKISSDYVSILLYVPGSNGMPNEYFLTDNEQGMTFLGIRSINGNDSWKPHVEAFLQKAGISLSQPIGIARLDRWYIPGSNKMGMHSVHVVAVRPEMKHFVVDKYKGMWMTVTMLISNQASRQLMSPDIVEIILRTESPIAPTAMGNELTQHDLFVSDDDLKRKKSGLELVVQAAQLGQQEQELLYKEFLNYTLPFLSMGLRSFSIIMEKLGWAQGMLPNLFRTFDMQNKGGLSFRDFICGVAAVEPVIQHGGPPAEIRCRYIFRYYDRDGDGKLSYDEFYSMVLDIRRNRGQSLDPKATQRETERAARVFGDKKTENLALSEFLTAVGQLKFRGTSHLLRSPSPLSTLLSADFGPLKLSGTVVADKTSAPSTPKAKRKLTMPAIKTLVDAMTQHAEQSKLVSNYDLAEHSVRVRKSGTLLDVHSLWNMNAESILKKPVKTPKSKPSPTPSDFTSNKIQSFDHFREEIHSNEMLNGLKYFERVIVQPPGGQYKGKPAFDWGEVDRTSLAGCIWNLCMRVRDIMSREPRLLEISAPVYIMGDIHGNFPDLVSFEKTLWRLGPILTPAAFLFLGDYVDRGDYSVEVMSYLFAHKLLAPKKFLLLRGNHEIREVQKMFTFHKECVAKFGDKLGNDIWEAFNSAFDCMPLGAVIDKKIFCAHGGIPPPWIGNGLLDSVNTIPCPLPRPEEMSQLAWELMWSDPLHLDQLTPEQVAKINLVDGYGQNPRRGTGHVFSADALQHFLTKNKLSHVVRAHEVQQSGFQVHHDGKLLSVFSSSKYCGGSNEAACILADSGRLRTIRIDTS